MTVVQRSVISMIAMQMLVVSIGCGSSDSKATAKVEGKITASGQPVTGGSMNFQPVGTGTSGVGKAASGTVQSDGTFKLTTYQPDDGAVIGKHRVTFTPPVPPTPDVPPGGHAAEVKIPYSGLVPAPAEVEIKAGDNKLTFELVPAN